MEQKNADWHRADVVAALKKKGWSVRALSIASGLAPDTLRVALQVSYPKGERIIAAAIGVKPESGRTAMLHGHSNQVFQKLLMVDYTQIQLKGHELEI